MKSGKVMFTQDHADMYPDAAQAALALLRSLVSHPSDTARAAACMIAYFLAYSISRVALERVSLFRLFRRHAWKACSIQRCAAVARLKALNSVTK